MSPRAFDDLDDARDGVRSAGERKGPSTVQYRAPESENILRRVIEIIDTSPGMPMSASVRVNKEELLELLDDAVSRLPDELRSARWLLKEREEFRAASRRDADDLIADAKAHVAQMVQRQEVVKAAEARAAQIIEEAEITSRRLRRETEDFCDQKLASFENVLARVQKTVAVGRQRLAAPTIEESELGERDRGERDRGEQPPGRPPRGARPEHAGQSEPVADVVPVFDQDV